MRTFSDYPGEPAVILTSCDDSGIDYTGNNDHYRGVVCAEGELSHVGPILLKDFNNATAAHFLCDGANLSRLSEFTLVRDEDYVAGLQISLVRPMRTILDELPVEIKHLYAWCDKQWFYSKFRYGRPTRVEWYVLNNIELEERPFVMP